MNANNVNKGAANNLMELKANAAINLNAPHVDDNVELLEIPEGIPLGTYNVKGKIIGVHNIANVGANKYEITYTDPNSGLKKTANFNITQFNVIEKNTNNSMYGGRKARKSRKSRKSKKRSKKSRRRS